ncbi:MAG: Asp-tRNA(Asn)/Glu-tRNA(Gln) amidotransferase subunit GatC [Mycoplasma sp.]
MKDTKTKLELLANSLKFELSDIEFEKILQEHKAIVKKFNLIKEIDTSNIVPTNFIHELDATKCWREDEPTTFDKNEVFSNTKLDENGYVVIKNEK